MPYPKQKSENYTNFGGTNEKASQYLLGVNEFLNISNFSFQKTGALTKDYGTTQYIPTGFSSILGLNQYNRFAEGVVGFSYIPLSSQIIIPDQVAVYGMTVGFTTPPAGVTYFTDINSIFTYQNAQILNGPQTGGFFDFTTFQNTLYACDGTQFFKYNSISAYAYGLPKLSYLTTGTNQTSVGGFTGYVNFAYALYNNYGLIGPAKFASYLVTGASGATALILGLGTNKYFGFTFNPADYGATYKLLWGQQATDTQYSLIAAGLPYDQVTYILTTTAFSLSAAGFTTLPFGSIGFTQPNDYIGAWAYRPNIDFSYILRATPRYLEIFNNTMIMAGVDDQPSNVFISDLGQPEITQFDSFFEVRTNDGDIVTGLKTFFNQLLIFKQFSFHSLRGDDFSNYKLQELSAEYGCLSNRAVVVWEQNCWFLDRKGICSYNGANIQIISQKMEETFKSMTPGIAATTAVMIHVKEKNEVWCCIPINGSLVNNCTVIYDYVAQSWRRREGVTTLNVTQSNQDSKVYGVSRAYSTIFSDNTNVGIFGSTFYSDGANGMTCVARTRYLNDLGNSVEKVFRRLYIDADAVTGVTQIIGINFYTNHATMAAYSTTMALTTFQSRIDFGLPAKDLAVEFVYNQNNPLRINGFTIEYRFQRAT